MNTHLFLLQDLEWRQDQNLLLVVRQQWHHEGHGLSRPSTSDENSVEAQQDGFSHIQLPIMRITSETSTKEFRESFASIRRVVSIIGGCCLTRIVKILVRAREHLDV